MAITAQQLNEALAWRYATKVFDPQRQIDASTWAALENSLVQSPSSYGLQPWKFLVITNPAMRAELRPHSWNQSQITDGSHLVVFLAERTIQAAEADRLISCMAETRAVESESLGFYREMIAKDLINGPRSQQIGQWASNQVYIALGTFMAAAALLEVDTCPIEGFSPAEYDRILKLEESPYRSCVVCAAGYRDASDKYASLGKVRYPAGELIEHI
ncbi:NAD(P)H-dependent oxidoreductase [Cyanobium sp. WAJ14-Wanaka]|uniref:NAD(P)H-dependent oxidoreductase n=1 Tax=Cyanobium sp. WAJ14-Wanaka TaxID=2823725 RepID=UPI0020CFA5BB|nr:NAD(P)H-dependent oxidoreductase [Cyanobium sp. WAJ14-Wanaka]MCP9774471.1 NAD(P)H-dependent oxidoreductase [Cyanobium sp. WAJ14-Wanaka]